MISRDKPHEPAKACAIDQLDVPKTVFDWMAKVRRTNAMFEKASPAKKRVMLAKDVLAAIEARRIEPSSGVYTSYISRDSDHARGLHNENVRRYSPSQPAVMTLYGEDCQVCAKGALFVARLDRLNGLPLRDLDTADPSEHLTDYFSQLQLDLIEAAFEGSDSLAYLADYCEGPEASPEAFSLSEREFEALSKKAKSYASAHAADERLRRIMLNIIANGGTFDPYGRKGLKKKPKAKTTKKIVAKPRTQKIAPKTSSPSPKRR